MIQIITIIQIILAVLLIIVILVQSSDSDGMEALGGGSDFGGNMKQKKRGFEKFIFEATIIIAIALLSSLVIPLFI